MKNLFLIVTFCIGIGINYGQRNVIDAAEYRALYPESDCAITDCKIKVSFIRKNDEVKAKIVKEYEICSLYEETAFFKSEVYSSNSTVEYSDFMSFDKVKDRYRETLGRSHEVSDRKVADDGIFHHDYRRKILAVYQTSVEQYQRFTEESHYSDIKFLTSFYFHENYPIGNYLLEIEMPEWLDIEIKEFNFEEAPVVKEETEEGKIVYKGTSLPNIKRQESAPGAAYYVPHLMFLPRSLTTESGEKVQLFESPADLYGWYKSLVDELKPEREELEPLVKELTEGKSEEEQIKSIYYWVQDNIKYIAFEDGIAGFKPAEAQEVCDNRYGDCKGMSNLMKEMLIIAGFDARLCWLGTRRLPYDYSTPCIGVDNHMICALMWNDRIYYLDATAEDFPFAYNHSGIAGKQVMIENGDSCLLRYVDEPEVKDNARRITRKLSLDGELLKGSHHEEITGEKASLLRSLFRETEIKDRKDVLQMIAGGHDKNFEPREVKLSGERERDSSIVCQYDFTLKNRAFRDQAGDFYIDFNTFRPLWGYGYEKGRQVPVMMENKWLVSESLEFDIPEGNKVMTYPKDVLIDNDLMYANMAYKLKKGKLQLSKEIHLKKSLIKVEDLEKWNAAINKLESFYSQLVKVEKI